MAKKKTKPKPAKSCQIGQLKKNAFLSAYAELGTITHAAKKARVSRESHRNWLRDDPEYPARFAEAHAESCEALEKEARRRAIGGVDKPVFQGGEEVGTVRVYSDTLLIFLMKGAMPDKYRERMDITQRKDDPPEGPEQLAAHRNLYELAAQKGLIEKGNGKAE
jgi:hypothetical protein